MTAHARRGDPETSHEAAASVKMNATQQLQLDILFVLDVVALRRSISDENIAHGLENLRGSKNFTDTGVRTRRHELVGLGFVVHSGYGRTRAGRACRLWRITPAGLAARAEIIKKGIA